MDIWEWLWEGSTPWFDPIFWVLAIGWALYVGAYFLWDYFKRRR